MRLVRLPFLSLVALSLVASIVQPLAAQTRQQPGLPSETPTTLKVVTDGFDYIKRDEMIPMRDGVKLHTVILIPKNATKDGARAPILPIGQGMKGGMGGGGGATNFQVPDQSIILVL